MLRLQGPGLLRSYAPPGFLRDLSDASTVGWSGLVSKSCNTAKAGDASDPFNGARPQFFNATAIPVGDDMALDNLIWSAFPKTIGKAAPNEETRWRRADAKREVQDEYCEWSVARDPDGKIMRITFTCEAPEYWEYLAAAQPDTVLELYRSHINSGVPSSDLFDSSGRYIRRNRWNSDTVNGAMHLIHDANPLAAVMELVAAATLVRTDSSGKLVTDTEKLMECGKYGNPECWSDPVISSKINALAKEGALVTLADPVGLYFDEFVPAGFITPDGSDARDYWRWTRGEEGFHVRAVFEVPPSKGFAVGDIKIQDKGNIRYGSMVAEYVKVKLVALACNVSPANVQAVQGCTGDARSQNQSMASASAVGAPRSRAPRAALAGARTFASEAVPSSGSTRAQVHRRVMGIDREDGDPVPMTEAEAAALLQDPFSKLMLLHAPAEDRPQSLEQLSQMLQAKSDPQEHHFQTFLVGDGGQISAKKLPDVNRSFRFVWTRTLGPAADVPAASSAAAVPMVVQEVTSDILVVAGKATASTTGFLQVASWDPTNRVWNFYAREIRPARRWVWNGSSLHALDPRSRGRGPFDGHVNGSLVMKELRAPWQNWHSSAAGIDSSIAANDPLRANAFFISKGIADDLERLVVRPGIAAWIRARLERAIQLDGTIGPLETPRSLLQHVFQSTSVNFITSRARSVQNFSNDPINLPTTFFINSQALGTLFDGELTGSIGDYTFAVPYQGVYLPIIKRYGFHLVGTSSSTGEGVSVPGDTFFAFLVPEPAQEDTAVVERLLRTGRLSERFLACALMVDFPNPVYSPVRLELLLSCVSDTGNIRNLEAVVVEKIRAAAEQGGSGAAQEFIRWWDLGESALKGAAVAAINNYLTLANSRSQSLQGFEDYVKLAESRRSAFRGFNAPLNEFRLTLPVTTIPDNSPLMKMLPDGTIAEIEGQHALAMLQQHFRRENVKCQSGCPFAVQ